MRFLSLAWRNVLRNRRRSSFAVTAIAIGVAALMFAWALFDGSNAQMIESMTGNYTGHVQIHKEGYTDDPTIERTLSEEQTAWMKAGALPGVAGVSPRIESPSLLSAGDNSRGIVLVGVDPDIETSVTRLQEKVAAGSYLDNRRPGGILVGQSLAKALDVSLGDEISVLTQGMYGSVGAQRYRVHGIYQTGNDMVDGLQAFITLNDAHQLLSSQGHLSTVAIRLADRGRTEDFVEELRGRLGPQYEVKGWRQLLPAVAQSIDFHEAMGRVVMFVLFGIVAVGVANTMLMSVMERVREFGAMLALGTRPHQLFRSIVYEGLLIGMVGFVVGLAFGGAVVGYLGHVGISYSKQSELVQSMQGVSNTIYPQLGLYRTLFVAAAVLAVTLLATLYPAWKTARLLPLQAMQGRFGRAPAGAGATNSAPQAARWLLPTLGLRNLGRHPMRTLLTVLAMAFGLGAFVFVASFANGYHAQIVENATGMLTGEAQLQHKDFKSDLKPSLWLPEGQRLLDTVRGMPGVAAASPRAQALGMVSSAARSEPVMVVGVEPAQEEKVTFLQRAVKEGHYLRSDSVAGKNEIVIGRKLGELLKVGLGDKVVVMVQDTQGQLASEAFVVAGLFDTGSHSLDKAIAHVGLPGLQRMLELGSNITSISLRTHDRAQLPMVLDHVSEAVASDIVRVLPWQELIPEVEQLSVIVKRALMMVLTVVVLMVGVVVMNTTLMSILERTREFGTMLALGSQPSLIVRLVLFECGLVGAVGALGGTALGALISWLHSITGVSLKSHGMTAIPGTTDVVFPQLTLQMLLVPMLLMPLVVLLASVYPALRASRLQPVAALRHV